MSIKLILGSNCWLYKDIITAVREIVIHEIDVQHQMISKGADNLFSILYEFLVYKYVQVVGKFDITRGTK